MKLIIGAMGKEIEAVVTELRDLKINYTNIELYQGYLEDEMVYVLKTGIGKVKSAYSLTKALMILENLDIKIDLVINIGLVGATSKFNIGSVYMVKKNTLSDFDLKIFNEYYKEFELNPKYDFLFKSLELEEAYLYTQDSFVSNLLKTDIEDYLVDMELASIWSVCDFEKIDLISLKYVSDHIIHVDQLETYKKNKNISSSNILLNYVKKLIKELKSI